MTYVNGVPEFEGVHIYTVHGCQLKVMYGLNYAFYYKPTEEYPIMLGDCTQRDGCGVVYPAYTENGIDCHNLCVECADRYFNISLDGDEFEMIPLRPSGLFGSNLEYILFTQLKLMEEGFTDADFIEVVSSDVRIYFMSEQAMNSYVIGFLLRVIEKGYSNCRSNALSNLPIREVG